MACDSASKLRCEIDIIVHNYKTQNKQMAALEELRSKHPHHINPAKIESFCKLPKEGPEYDCFTFALDLIDCQERIAVCKFAPRSYGKIYQPGIADALPGSNFLKYLNPNLLSGIESCSDFDLAVYYDKFGKAKHAGKIYKGSITSKWGKKGALWQHGIFEVPSSYGTSVKYYTQMTKDYVRKRWIDYLRQLAIKVKEFTEVVSYMSES